MNLKVPGEPKNALLRERRLICWLSAGWCSVFADVRWDPAFRHAGRQRVQSPLHHAASELFRLSMVVRSFKCELFKHCVAKF